MERGVPEPPPSRPTLARAGLAYTSVDAASDLRSGHAQVMWVVNQHGPPEDMHLLYSDA